MAVCVCFLAALAALVTTTEALGDDTSRRGVRRPYVVRASAMGVQDFHIPGVIDLAYKGREAVVLHIYLKALATNQTVRWRGFMFAESIEREYYNFGQTEISQPPLLRDWDPHVYLSSVFDGSVFTFAVHKAQAASEKQEDGDLRFVTPVPLTLALPHAAAAHHGSFELRVDDWKSFAYLSPGLRHKPQVAFLARAVRPPRFFIVLSPFFAPMTPARGLRLLLLHLEYHRRLGFARIIQYLSPPYVSHFTRSQAVRAAVRARHLQLVMWDASTECAGHTKCFQPVMNSHALLTHWGRNVFLFMIDQDEYVAVTRRGDTIGQAIMRCGRGAGHVQMQRFETVCGDCTRLGAEGGAEGTEAQLWYDNSSIGPHPIAHYSLRFHIPFGANHGKSLAHPQRVIGFNVHRGSPVAWPQDDVEMDARKCGVWLAHIVNMNVYREHRIRDKLKYVRDAKWHWVVEDWPASADNATWH